MPKISFRTTAPARDPTAEVLLGDRRFELQRQQSTACLHLRNRPGSEHPAPLRQRAQAHQPCSEARTTDSFEGFVYELLGLLTPPPPEKVHTPADRRPSAAPTGWPLYAAPVAPEELGCLAAA